ncbi:c-type cytochrome [Methylocella sp.]|uniref:c-type cytochrome n=1 Tax=Methylocella sp. TaxID=1978226 RepID=UPI003783946C
MRRAERRTGIRGVVFALAGAGFALSGAFAPAAAQKGDAARGETIARRWCASCHVVAPGQSPASDGAPSFMSVAAKVVSPDALKAFLADPHPKMPDMSLTRDEIADLAAYIVGLEPKP